MLSSSIIKDDWWVNLGIFDNRLAFIPFAASKVTLILDCKIEDGKNSHGIDVKNSLKSWWNSWHFSGIVTTILSKVCIKDS